MKKSAFRIRSIAFLVGSICGAANYSFLESSVWLVLRGRSRPLSSVTEVRGHATRVDRDAHHPRDHRDDPVRSGPIQRGLWFIVVAVLALVSVAQARTITAASCSQANVQTAINAAVAGDTVVIPAGTCTWTTQVSWTAPANVTLQGAGSQTTTGGGDVTVIIDGVVRGSDIATLSITTNASGTFRLTAITFRGNGNSNTWSDNGTVRIGGTSQQVRIDHVHFDRLRRQPLSLFGIYGVVDHSLFDMVTGTLDNAVRPNGVFATWGDPEWAAATGFGGSSFMYIEDNVFNNGIINDCSHGGKQVFRYNTFNNASSQTHPTGSQGRARGCRAMEIYHNTFTGGACSPNCFNVHFVSAGGLLIWGNSTGTSYQNFVTIHSMRKNNSTYSETATPNGWGYCGTAFNGTGSKWDQNTDGSTGYACLDQPGRGKGDRLSLDFPNTNNNTTNTIAWPNQALEPIYEWLNTWTGSGGGSFWAVYEPTVLVQNRDYYLHASPFTGVAGTGTGTLSARPATCTPAVAYWATDTNTLYQCSSTNTWTAYYTPYTYPHPLVSGGPAESLLSPPTNLRVQ
jgi:hypothetical protein